jgi:hypothetical protein
VPIRLYCVGIEFLIRGDEGVLLDLVAIDRQVLLKALRLERSDRSERATKSQRKRSAVASSG